MTDMSRCSRCGEPHGLDGWCHRCRAYAHELVEPAAAAGVDLDELAEWAENEEAAREGDCECQ